MCFRFISYCITLNSSEKELRCGCGLSIYIDMMLVALNSWIDISEVGITLAVASVGMENAEWILNS